MGPQGEWGEGWMYPKGQTEDIQQTKFQAGDILLVLRYEDPAFSVLNIARRGNIGFSGLLKLISCVVWENYQPTTVE